MKTATLSNTEQRRLGEFPPLLLRGLVSAGLFFIALSIPLAFMSGAERFFRSYLMNYCFFLTLGIGALYFVMMQHLVRAGWSVTVRRLGEMVAANLFPLLAVLLIPILIGMKYLYPWQQWSQPGVLSEEQRQLIAFKVSYLTPTLFILRCAIYFLVWGGLARYFLARSLEQDETGDASLTLRMQKWSAPGMVAFGIFTTLASFDLVMSLNPEFYSTIFGVYLFSGGVVSFFSLLAIMALALQRRGRLNNSITTEHYQDVGKFAFGFTVFWTYIAFSQFMLIWYANLPEETFWIRSRLAGQWTYVSLLLLLGHFVLPFLWLMSRYQKRRRLTLAVGAGWLLFMHWIDMYWIIMPSRKLHEAQLHGGGNIAELAQVSFNVLDITLFVGLGCLFAAATLARMKKHALIPERDPRLGEALAFENF